LAFYFWSSIVGLVLTVSAMFGFFLDYIDITGSVDSRFFGLILFILLLVFNAIGFHAIFSIGNRTGSAIRANIRFLRYQITMFIIVLIIRWTLAPPIDMLYVLIYLLSMIEPFAWLKYWHKSIRVKNTFRK